MLFGRAPSAESLPGEVSQPQGPDLGAIVLALQAQVGEEVLALQVEIGGLREEVGGLRERVKFLENNVGSSGYQSTKAPTVFFDEIDGEAWPTSRPPVHKMAEPSGERGGEDGGLGHGSPGDLELKVDRVTDDREEGDRGGPEDGSGGGQPSPWLTEELEQSYELQASMWDAAVYIGTDAFGFAGSAYAALLLILNLSIQVIFVVIVWGIVMSPPIDASSVEGFRSWRRNIAHSVNQMDELSQRSLSSRVCAGDAGLETSQGQADAYSSILAYLKQTMGPPGDGFLMCVLSLLMWYLSVGKEVTGSISLIRGMWGLPAGITLLAPEGDEPHSTRFESISSARRAFVVSVQVLRLGVALTLMHAGTMFLAATISLSDLLLNAVALEFVLSVDELLFEALAPVKLCLLISGGTPLPLPPVRAWKGLNWAACLLLLAIVALLAAMLPIYVIPQVGILKSARDALCGGETAFVYTMGGSGLPTWGESTREGQEESPLFDWRESTEVEDAALDFVGKAVEAAIGGHGTYRYPDGKACGTDGLFPPETPGCFDPAGCPEPFCFMQEARESPTARKCCLARQIKAPQITAGRFSVQTVSREDAQDATSIWNPVCADVLLAGYPYENLVAGALADAIGSDCPPDPSIDFPGGKCPAHIAHCDIPTGKCVFPSCGDAKPHCYNDTTAGSRARQYCPITCGCDDLTSPLVLITPDYGCPKSCSRSANYKAKMASLPCVDAAAGSAEMNMYADGLSDIGGTWPTNWQEGIVLFVSPGFRAAGCAILPLMGTAGDFCVEKGTFWPIKPVRYLCPVSCGCKKGMDQCPDTCPQPTVNDTFLVRDV